MRFLCTIIALVLTVCLGAKSDRSRQRSSPIRSVPVAADIKRDVDFDCPEEFGYYPHPTDCTLYYVCVFGGALLESCTGGLMYSHELQTCDWPRNVGCDGTSAIGSDDLERISEREPPPPPPPRRTPPPPPPPRAQPNPVVTSRGQPKFSRDEYEKQQQLYAEVDDLPPVEEIESDRQQRVNRGQPPTIGQVQKDRDGYISQTASSGRNLNSNIIPASIPQNNGKIGSFSFGTQVDDRRAAVVTQAPQAYSEDKRDYLTDYLHDRQLDLETNEINVDDRIENSHVRRKRQLSETNLGAEDKNSTSNDQLSKRSDHDEEIEFSLHSDDDENDNERGKRQIRYYVKNGYSKPTKNWVIAKPIKLVNIPQFGYNNQNNQGTRFSSNYNGLNGNQFYDNRNPYTDDNSYAPSQADSYQFDVESQRPFKPSLPDPMNSKYVHNPASAPTQIITKSPPISSLNNNENPFASLAGGFYNNAPKQMSLKTSTNRPNYPVIFRDSSQLPSTLVTAKPVYITSSPRPNDDSKSKFENNQNIGNDQDQYRNGKNYQNQDSHRPPLKEEDYKDRDNSSEYDDSDESSEDESREENEKDDDSFKHDFPEPPYEFTHPKYKYSEIDNPFANPNFDFDEFLAKLSNGQYSPSTTQKYKNVQMAAIRATESPVKSTTASSSNSVYITSTLNYKGMSSPKPFTGPLGTGTSTNPKNILHQTDRPTNSGQWIQIPETGQKTYIQQQEKRLHNQNVQIVPQQTLPDLRQPNFKDQRQSSINQNFQRLIASTPLYDEIKNKGNHQRIVSISQNPFAVSTGAPIILSTPKQQYLIKPEKIISLQPHIVATGKPYLISTVKPHNAYTAFKHSTAKPLTTIANQQLLALQNYWQNLSTESQFSVQSTPRPNSASNHQKNSNYLSSTIRPILKDTLTTTTMAPKRRPIPKPSPEMNDYYYDDDEQFYYEPPVKSKYMPSSEVKPKRPPMAQNYKEYDDNYSYEEIQEHPVKQLQSSRAPTAFTTRPETSRNPNNFSGVTKSQIKDFNKIVDGKIAVPVLIDYSTPAPTILRPEISNYKILHHQSRNRTIYMKKPIILSTSGPFTQRPPKYLNQTTLRPYTVRHRLAKPTTENVPVTLAPINDFKGKVRHQNIVAQTKFTTPRDNFNQETRYTKTKHDDRINSLEPTESVAPVSYSASPRPKMLYNGSQNYSPDQYDPYYAVYDEDGELYKDNDYVQQYNTASLRPAVQQTYRGTPPSRRPVDAYTPRPVSSVDYDDALIQGQVNNQNQYQSAIRQSTRPASTRGRGSAHYSTLNGGEAPQPVPNRGTPPTRNRPTLKPSTAIVSKSTEFVDIYTYPPRRSAPVYPQPTPDKTAAKCRKDVCLLPDCYCGGKDIPGELPVETVPQIVLLTFDDSVNDLNKGLYTDLFEKGRVNPNGCPISATFYVSHEWTDYSQVQNLYAAGHEMASHTISHSFGEQFSQKKWNREVGGQREILAAYGGVKLEDVRGMRAPFLSVGGNKMFKMLYDSNFTYDSSMPVYENRPPSWPYTLDYKLFHDCMIPPCPTKSYPGVWEVPMVMWQDLNGGRCSMGDACANPPDAEGVYKMILKNFDRHYTTNRAPFGLFYHAAWFTQPHHKEGFIMFLDFINQMQDVWIITNWQALQWVRDPTPISRINNFQPFQCNYPDRPKKCNNPKVCNLWHKSGVRYMRTCQPCPEVYPWTGKTGIRSSRIDNDNGE
ncbi:uncharacterized protein Cda5 isoform X6 [Plodia interpunctella]|uniref:uncharacterized protein Cda5 isoform X6 n=1 Tax=Plodia interpunctella TaxID=58824 RepID=UPI0023688B3D|nr:uncharacterized protein LOC128680104 isoform X6 [Plodia interpunctella]